MLTLLLACATDPAKLDTASSGAHDTAEDTGLGPDTVGPADLANQVSQDELVASITELQAAGTRYVGTAGNTAARGWIVERFEALGLPVEEDPFDAQGAAAANVIARLEGTDPTRVWIYSAHFDSTSSLPDTVAPGADDNASGVAAVLEAARILKDVPLRDSIWFVATDAEELGSLGSAHMVGWLQDEGWDVQGVIAPDMIGYWPLGDGDAFDILGDPDSEWMVDDMSAMADTLGVAHKTWIRHNYCYGDDHTNFQESGFPAISPMDCVEAHNVGSSGEDTPHYHQTTDTIETLHMPFTTRVTGVIVATLAVWAGG
jgi:hypothetical protein